MQTLITPDGKTVSIGDGATELHYTDRSPYTVVGWTASGKTLILRACKAVRTDSNGMSECQVYTYEEMPEMPTIRVRWTKRGWRKGGRRFAIGARSAYHDYSF